MKANLLMLFFTKITYVVVELSHLLADLDNRPSKRKNVEEK